MIDDCARLLDERVDCVMATVAHEIEDPAEFTNPNVVKVVLDARGHALYFSRATIPWARDAFAGNVIPSSRIDLVAREAVKYYPAGATTHSDAGVTRLERTFAVLERMQERGMVLQVHGEVTDPAVDVFDREHAFNEADQRLLTTLASSLSVARWRPSPCSRRVERSGSASSSSRGRTRWATLCRCLRSRLAASG